MRSQPERFGSIWIVICNVEDRAGEPVAPRYLAAAVVGSEECAVEISAPELQWTRWPPYPTTATTLLVTIEANALVGCHFALGWPLPERVIDLLVEFRVASNGQRRPVGAGLMGACVWFGLPAVLGLDQGATPAALQHRLDALRQLLVAMLTTLDLDRALLRGRYMIAVAKMEAIGVPADRCMIERLRRDWPETCRRVAWHVDRGYGVLHGCKLRVDAFETWLDRHCVPWPRTPAGHLDLGDDCFRDIAPMHDALLIEAPIAQVDEAVSAVQQHMDDASRIVLDGFSLRSDVKVVRSPERFRDRRGAAVWEALECVLQDPPEAEPLTSPPVHKRDATCSSANPRPISLSVSKRGRSDVAH
jgi:hypothetical protein